MSQTTIQDVAREARVSVSTVSRSFTRPDLVSAKTRARVLDVAQKMDFRLSRSAAALKSGRSFRIALLLPSPITNWFNVTVYSGLNSVLQPAGYDISVFSIATWEERRRFFSSMPVRRNSDAVILCSFNTVANEMTELRNTGVPVIGINTAQQTGLDADISLDDEASEKIAVQHLIGLGHRHLAFVYTSHDTPFDFSADKRQTGFNAAISEARASGLDVSSTVIACPYDEDPVNMALAKLLALTPQPTAVIFQTDDIAVPVLMRLRRYGKRVPEDYSAVGFDDATYAADAELTTMHQDPAELGRQAAQMTLNLIEHRNADPADPADPADAADAADNADGASIQASAQKALKHEDLFKTVKARLILRDSTAPIGQEEQ